MSELDVASRPPSSAETPPAPARGNHDDDRRFLEAFDSAPLGITIIGAQAENYGLFLRANRAYCTLLGYREDEIVGRWFTTFVAPHERAEAEAMTSDLMAGRIGVMRRELQMLRVDGAPIWVRLTRSLMRDEVGRPVCFFTHLEDVTQRHAVQSELTQMTTRLQRLVDDAPIGMSITSLEPATMGQFMEVNPALSRITGLSRDTLLTMRLDDLIHPQGRNRAAEVMRKLIDREESLGWYQERCIRQDGTIGWLAVHASIAYEAEQPLYCIAQIIDITRQKEAETKLQHLAYHDALTGVLNRRGLTLEFQTQLTDAAVPAEPSAALLLDLDHFSYVNETMGTTAGDRILRKVAVILQRVCPPGAIIARLGADEFFMVLAETGEAEAVATADAIRRNIQSSITLGTDSDIRATASLGLVLINTYGDQTLNDAIAAANTAVAHAKSHGRDRHCVADAVADGNTAMRAVLTWSQRIRNALERDAFTLYAQPILNLRNGIVERYELLLRMIDPDGRVRMPGEFLPIAERAGMMPDIDCWVVKRAIDLAAAEKRAGRHVVFEVNLSGASLTNENVATFIERELRTSTLDPQALVFEITETAAIENMDEARKFAEKIGALGCAFALDDFGAGFSSFYYLKYLPFNDLKIDGEFIRNLVTNVSDQHIVRAIVELARGFGKSTIAEFVGDAETALLLQQYGVDYAQGYYIGEPLPWELARESHLRILHAV